ncbi:hypothetical protein NKR23_g3999 [Pleurostoma richardsiae]|uniref:Uncharacterized protein n=1 Tax=Pleurostoma richardsiae TaxID=41990 RepID=A0AA38S348_9PEZI|nr:hypothetical protein NKR23_g3999 [Pleurostoma richardsiae]
MADLSPLIEAEDISAADIAQALGFSSFDAGSKKRKFNLHRDDAIVDRPTGARASPAGSGANSTALGRRPINSNSSTLPLHTGGSADLEQKNADEIALEDDEDGNDPEPHYIDMSRSPRPLHDDEVAALTAQAQIGAKLGAEGHAAEQVSIAGDAFTPDRHQTWYGRSGRGRGRSHGRTESVRLWWTEYHDPSFNDNPWSFLEKAKGLEPRGAWPSRGSVVGKNS